MKNLQKGFTLIELLVVIAIIGILSSIVLTSLSQARTKSEDAAIQSTVSNMRAQAELYYSINNNYGSSTVTFAVCPSTSGSANMFSTTTSGGLFTLSKYLTEKATAANTRCGSLGTSWTVMAQSKSNDGQYYCADSSGASVVKTASLPASTGVAVTPCP